MSLRFHSDCTAGEEPALFPTGTHAQKKNALCYEACCCGEQISPVCILPSKKTNQGHLRTTILVGNIIQHVLLLKHTLVPPPPAPEAVRAYPITF